MPNKGTKRQHDSMYDNELVCVSEAKKAKVLEGREGPQFINVINKNGNKLHPLEVDNVVEFVMSKLERPDLMNCRRVSKLFCLHASEQLAKRGTSPIILKNSIASGRFKKLMQDSQEPGKRYTMFGNFIIQNRISNKMLEHFSEFGSMVQHLRADLDESLAASPEPSIINFENMFNVLQHTPNVESLTLHNLNYPAIKRGGQQEQVAAVTGPQLPFLSTLIIKTNLSRSEIHHKHCFKPGNASMACRFQQIAHKLSSAVPNLKRLELHLSSPDVLSRSFRNWNANIRQMMTAYLNESSYLYQELGVHKLEHLVINAAYAFPNNLENLLSTQASTLKTLHFSVPSVIMEPDFDPVLGHYLRSNNQTFQQTSDFPIMEKLESLSLVSSYANGPYAIGKIRHDVNIFPKLQFLEISDEILQCCFPANGVYDAVQELHILYDSFDHNRNELASRHRVDLFSLFPNIRKLTIQLVGGPSVYGILPTFFRSAKINSSKVRELVINCKEGHTGYSTPIFTGLTQPWAFARILEQCITDHSSTNKSTERDLRISIQNLAEPNLLSFKNLEILDIAFNQFDHIDDATAVIIFYGMSPLKKLTVTNANISPYCQDQLKEIHGEVVFKEEQQHF